MPLLPDATPRVHGGMTRLSFPLGPSSSHACVRLQKVYNLKPSTLNPWRCPTCPTCRFQKDEWGTAEENLKNDKLWDKVCSEEGKGREDEARMEDVK